MARRAAQAPIPGLDGPVRFGRTAAATVPAQAVAVHPGRVSLHWETTVDPDAVIFYAWVPGDPRVKQREVHTRAALTEQGELRQGHVFTPTDTRTALKQWQWIYKAERRYGPVEGPVGMRAIFRCSGRRKADYDNLEKLLSDAGNGILYVDDAQVVQSDTIVRRARPEMYGTDILFWRL